MKNIQFDKISKINSFPVNLLVLILVLLISSMSGKAQTNNITGKVLSDSGIAVAGVSVHVKGTSRGTITESDGSFSINAVPGSVLEFSEVGFASKEVKVGSSSLVNITLTHDARTLNEVVVVGYGTVKKSDLTGSVSIVSAAEIEKVPVTVLAQSLQGRAAGVQVTNNDGAPGGGLQVQIQGRW